MRTDHTRSISGRWVVLAAAALSLGFAAEAAAQFNTRGQHGGSIMRGSASMRPPAMNSPGRVVMPGNRGSYERLARPPRETGPRGPRGPGGMHPPRYPRGPRGPIFVAPFVPGIFLPPAIIDPYDDDDAVPVPPPPGFRAPPPRQMAQPPQPPRRTSTGVPPSNERRYVPNEVVVEVANGFSAQQAEALARRLRLIRLESFSLALSDSTMLRWRIPDRRSVSAVVRALETDANVRTAQPNYLYRLAQEATPQKAALTTSTGESVHLQYALGKLKLSQAHNMAKGDKILIAVIDSGVDASHPELVGMVADELDTVGGAGPKAHTHGTAIAGTIVAHAKLMGVAPSARILAVRAFGGPSGDGDATTFAILRGLDWSAARGARVVNMSFAGPPDPAISRSIAAARGKGIVLVAAVGNAGPRSAPLYPAADRNVIAVTATDPDDKLFAKANRGKHITVAAPGVDILLPAPNAAYQVSSGTSFSAAFVSGTIALLFERKPDLSPDDVRRVLVDTAADLGPKGIDDQFGAGLIDAYQAVFSLAPVAEAEAAKAIPAAAR